MKTTQVQFLGEVLVAPVVVQRQVPGLVRTVQIIVGAAVSVVAQRQLPVWVFAAVSMQRQVPLFCAENVDFPQVQFLAWSWTSADVWDEPSTTHSCELSRARGGAGSPGVLTPR